MHSEQGVGSLPAAVSCPFSPFSLVHSTEPVVQENGDEAGEGREAKDSDPGSPRRCDIIIISGRKEKCEAAKEALEVCVHVPLSTPRQGPVSRHLGRRVAWMGWTVAQVAVAVAVEVALLLLPCAHGLSGCASRLDTVWGGHFPSPRLGVL